MTLSDTEEDFIDPYEINEIEIHISNTETGEFIRKLDFIDIEYDLRFMTCCSFDKNNIDLYTGFENGHVVVIGC